MNAHLMTALLAILSLTGCGAPSASTGPKPLPAACTRKCVTPHGAQLGQAADGVPAYSNCNETCVVFEPSRHEGQYTGIKWQCVEYARRWLLVHHGAVYGDVDIAADIWKHTELTRPAGGAPIPLETHENGATVAPKVGDLLIYAAALRETGHVAIVTAVDTKTGTVEVGEQNFDNAQWPGPYARKLPVIEREGRWWVLDPYLLGWKHPVVASR